MNIERFSSNPVLPSGATVPLSGAVRAGDFIFVSGQLAVDDNWLLVEGDIGSQTRQTLKNLEARLSECGARIDQVVKVTAWLSRQEDFPAFNAAYAEVFGSCPPARSTVLSGLLIPGALVEIEALALLTKT